MTAFSQEQARLIGSMKGVGDITVASLIAGLPEQGKLNRWEISALTGVAPLSRDSGKTRGKRTTFDGRAGARVTLDMAALVATQSNPAIKLFYQRLLAAGKPKKLAPVACMRRLITILSTMLGKGEEWNALSQSQAISRLSVISHNDRKNNLSRRPVAIRSPTDKASAMSVGLLLVVVDSAAFGYSCTKCGELQDSGQ